MDNTGTLHMISCFLKISKYKFFLLIHMISFMLVTENVVINQTNVHAHRLDNFEELFSPILL